MDSFDSSSMDEEEITFQKSDKGEQIEILKGSYAGEIGWLSLSRCVNSETHQGVWVKKNGKSKNEKNRNKDHATRIQKDSYRLLSDLSEEPKNFFEAVLHVRPDLDGLLNKLAKKFVECGITNNESNPDDLALILFKKIEKADMNARKNYVHWPKKSNKKRSQS